MRIGVGTHVHTRAAFTMVEVLISITIISLALLPILYLSTHNVETARLDRVRVAAETLCHNTLERFGRAEDNAVTALTQNPSNPMEWSGLDLYLASPHLKEALGAETIETLRLAQLQELTQIVTLTLNQPPGMHTLRCRVTWMSDHDRTRKQESVDYVRFILQ